ncbi:GAF domain-containing sensor histidine kinase [Rhodocaloribacter litoris]|nr:GAF domain-containing sensor histidine kinase [Rhodocaloribacter litoris]
MRLVRALRPGRRLRAPQYERLLEISVRLNTMEDLDDLLQYIIETAAGVLDCEAASLLLFEEEGGCLRFAAATGSDPVAIRRILVPLDGSIAGAVFTENRPRRIDDVRAVDGHFDGVDRQVGFRTRSLLGVPMRIDGRPTGVLEALNKRTGAFTDADAEVLTILAAHAAIALRNARQRQALQQAYDKLASFDRLKSDFLALASHELRTPLAAITGVLDLLRAEVEGPLASFVEDAGAAARRMREVIDVMGYLERIRTGGLEASLHPVCLNALIECIDLEMKPEARRRGHRVTLDLSAPSVCVPGDEGMLHRVFTSLWSNALRFTPEPGEITVRLCVEDDRAHVAIRDTGIGLAPEHRERIFDEFF